MRAGRGLVRRSVAISFAGALTCACAVLSTKLVACVDLASLGNGPPDSSAPAEDVTPPAPVDLCTHDRPIGRGDIDDAVNEELPPFVLAVDEAKLNPSEVPGYDLDGVCTCDPRPGATADGGGSCVAPDAARASVPISCDLEGGVDNAVAKLAQVNSPIESVDKLPNRVASKGRRTLLLQIGKYNGRANDGEVGVGAILADGIREQGCPSSTFVADTNTWSPGRCGNDQWTVDDTSMVGSVAVVGGMGYVRDYQLVVRLERPASMPFSEEGFILLESAIVSATIVPLGEDLQPRDRTRPPTAAEQRLFRLERGVLAGRVSSAEILSAVGSYRPGGGAYLCSSGAFPAVQQSICDSVDVRLGEATDRNLPCDALSIAFGFAAVPALMGARVDAGPRFNGCDPTDGAPLACP